MLPALPLLEAGQEPVPPGRPQSWGAVGGVGLCPCGGRWQWCLPVPAGDVPPVIWPRLGHLRGVNLSSMRVMFPSYYHCPCQAQGMFGTRSLYLESPQGSPFPEPSGALFDTNQAD